MVESASVVDSGAPVVWVGPPVVKAVFKTMCYLTRYEFSCVFPSQQRTFMEARVFIDFCGR